MSRHGVTAQSLVVVAAVVTVLGYAASLVITRDGTLLQPPPWPATVLLLVIGGLVLWFARPVRRHLRSGRRTSVDALRSARTVVLAQASALTGAAVGGWYLGQLVALLGELDLVANRERVLPFGLALVAAAVLAVCGMVGQAWCRIDRDDENGFGGDEDADA